MENWDDFKYGPLRVFSTEGRMVDFGKIVSLGQAEFTVMLRLMTCRGGLVSRALLMRGLISEYMLRVSICRLRKFLKKRFGDTVTIKTVRQYGYRLSLAGEFSFPYSIWRLCPSVVTRSAIFWCLERFGSISTKVRASVRAASTSLRFLRASIPRSESPDCLAP